MYLAGLIQFNKHSIRAPFVGNSYMEGTHWSVKYTGTWLDSHEKTTEPIELSILGKHRKGFGVVLGFFIYRFLSLRMFYALVFSPSQPFKYRAPRC